MHPTLSYLTAADLVKVNLNVEEKEEEKRNVHELALMEKNLREKVEELQKSRFILKQGKRSKLGFPELGLVVKSKIVGDTRLWPCSVEGCIEAFKMSRSCDSHINTHLGYEYSLCEKCGYTNMHLNSFEKHKCFSNLEEKWGRKRKASAASGSAASGSASAEFGSVLGEKKKREDKEEKKGKE